MLVLQKRGGHKRVKWELPQLSELSSIVGTPSTPNSVDPKVLVPIPWVWDTLRTKLIVGVLEPVFWCGQ